jgi:hypothetical protein
VHTRIIQTRGAACGVRRHDVGLRLYLWELLPDPGHRDALDRHPAFGEKITDRG